MTTTLKPWRLKALIAGTASLVLAAMVAACGGGGVGSGGTGGFASGPITGFGSVIVNEVRFDDSSASVEDGDGNRKSRDDLRLGMTVDIDSGTITSGSSGQTGSATATRIRYDSELRGPVGLIDVAGSSFNVLGQRVVVDTTTVFAESLGGLPGLSTGTLVEVYAVYDPAANRYRAKRVDTASASATAQLRGLVNQLDASGKTLRIGLITYDYATATGAPADLAVGQFVRLRVSVTPSNGRFTVLSFGTALRSLPDADGASVKGLITAFTSTSTFSVNGRPVDASTASFPDGSAGLALGVRVEVKGNLRAGTLRATEVKIRTDQQEDDSGFELHGLIESVNTAGQTFVLRGQTVSTARPGLVYENGTAANLAVGRRVEVDGRLSADRLRIEATKIKFEN
jgi:Domain of unknown function (DUF5666)